MSDQTTRVRAALRAQATRFLDFDLSTRGQRVDLAALAEVVTAILRAQEATDLTALADRLDTVPAEQEHWSLDQSLGWLAAQERLLGAVRAEADRLTAMPEPAAPAWWPRVWQAGDPMPTDGPRVADSQGVTWVRCLGDCWSTPDLAGCVSSHTRWGNLSFPLMEITPDMPHGGVR